MTRISSNIFEYFERILCLPLSFYPFTPSGVMDFVPETKTTGSLCQRLGRNDIERLRGVVRFSETVTERNLKHMENSKKCICHEKTRKQSLESSLSCEHALLLDMRISESFRRNSGGLLEESTARLHHFATYITKSEALETCFKDPSEAPEETGRSEDTDFTQLHNQTISEDLIHI